MLGEKQWKTDAVVRLLISVFICMYAGSVLNGLLHRSGAAAHRHPFVLPLGILSIACLGASLVLLRKKWELDHVMRRLTIVLALFYVGIFLGAWTQKYNVTATNSSSEMAVSALSFQGAVLVLGVFFLRDHETNWNSAFGLTHGTRRAVLLGLVGACLFLPIGWGLQQASAFVFTHLPRFGFRPEEQHAVQVLKAAVSWRDRVMLAVITICLAPLAEEFLFRGVLYPWIKGVGYPRLAVWVTSIFFAAVHLNLVLFLPLLVLALLLTALYERTQNLAAPIATHCLFNALNFGMVYVIERYSQ